MKTRNTHKEIRRLPLMSDYTRHAILAHLDRFYPDIVASTETYRKSPFFRFIKKSLDHGTEKYIVPVDNTSTTNGNMVKQAYFFYRNLLLAAKIADVRVSHVGNNADIGGDKRGELIDLTFIVGANLNNGMGVPVLQRGESQRHA